MYNWDNYDNDIAYSYDDYVEPVEEQEEDIDGIIEMQKLEALEYESKMAEQMIDSIYEKN